MELTLLKIYTILLGIGLVCSYINVLRRSVSLTELKDVQQQADGLFEQVPTNLLMSITVVVQVIRFAVIVGFVVCSTEVLSGFAGMIPLTLLFTDARLVIRSTLSILGMINRGKMVEIKRPNKYINAYNFFIVAVTIGLVIR